MKFSTRARGSLGGLLLLMKTTMVQSGEAYQSHKAVILQQCCESHLIEPSRKTQGIHTENRSCSWRRGWGEVVGLACRLRQFSPLQSQCRAGELQEVNVLLPHELS